MILIGPQLSLGPDYYYPVELEPARHVDHLDETQESKLLCSPVGGERMQRHRGGGWHRYVVHSAATPSRYMDLGDQGGFPVRRTAMENGKGWNAARCWGGCVATRPTLPRPCPRNQPASQANEHAWLLSRVLGRYVHIGCNDMEREGAHVWPTGESCAPNGNAFVRWAPGEPNDYREHSSSEEDVSIVPCIVPRH